MSNKRLVAAKAYLPVRGVNFDSNSLSMGEDESSSVSNLRVLPNEVRTRGGSRRISIAPITGDPILHVHNWKAPTGTEVIFGFTQNTIHRLNSANGSWDPIFNSSVLDGGTSTVGWNATATVSGAGTSVVSSSTTAPVWTGAHINFAYFDPNNASAPAYYIRKTFASVNLTALKRFSFAWKVSLDGTKVDTTEVTYKITFYSDVAWTTAIEAFTWTTSVDDADLTKWNVESFSLTTPANWSVVRSLKIEFVSENGVGAGTLSRSANVSLDSLTFYDTLGTNVSFWSTTSFVDRTYGATVVAAGSNPPKINDPEDDGSERILLYYDQSTSTFKTLVQRETVRLTAQATGADGGGTNKGPFTFTLGSVPLVPFSVNLLTGGYRLVDTGAGTFSGDGTGTVNYTTGECVVTFVAGVGTISADYMYYATVTKYPRFVSNYASRLVMGSTYEDSTTYYPWRIAWSDVADITVVRDDAYSDTVDNDISSIQAFSYSGEYLIIYKAETVIKMRHVGGDSVFGFFTVWRYGLFAMRSVIEWNNINFLFGKDDIYMFDGNQFKPLATNRVRNRLFDIINRDRLQYCFGSFDEKYKEYWLWVVKSGEDYPTEVFVYSIPLDAWTYFQFEPTTCVGAYYSIAGVTIDELIGTIDQQNWALNSGTLEGTVRNPIMCLEAGDAYTYDDRLGEDYIVNDVGTAIAYHLITKDFIYSDLPRKDRTQRVQFEAEGTSVTVGHTSRYVQETSAFMNKKAITLTPEHTERRYWPDSVYEKIRLSFEGSGYFSLRWIQTFAVTEELD